MEAAGIEPASTAIWAANIGGWRPILARQLYDSDIPAG